MQRLAACMGLSLFKLILCSGPQKTHLFCNRGRSGSFKVDDFGTNRKRVYDFLLVLHCVYGPILHRFWDTATYWLEIAYFCYPSFILRPGFLCSLWKFALKLTVKKTRVMGLSSSEDRMLVAGVVLAWYWTVTDRQTSKSWWSWIRDYVTALSVTLGLSVPAYVRQVCFRHGVRYLTEMHLRLCPSHKDKAYIFMKANLKWNAGITHNAIFILSTNS